MVDIKSNCLYKITFIFAAVKLLQALSRFCGSNIADYLNIVASVLLLLTGPLFAAPQLWLT